MFYIILVLYYVTFILVIVTIFLFFIFFKYLFIYLFIYLLTYLLIYSALISHLTCILCTSCYKSNWNKLIINKSILKILYFVIKERLAVWV